MFSCPKLIGENYQNLRQLGFSILERPVFWDMSCLWIFCRIFYDAHAGQFLSCMILSRQCMPYSGYSMEIARLVMHQSHLFPHQFWLLFLWYFFNFKNLSSGSYSIWLSNGYNLRQPFREKKEKEQRLMISLTWLRVVSTADPKSFLASSSS